jgi:hypothetical protein
MHHHHCIVIGRCNVVASVMIINSWRYRVLITQVTFRRNNLLSNSLSPNVEFSRACFQFRHLKESTFRVAARLFFPRPSVKSGSWPIVNHAVHHSRPHFPDVTRIDSQPALVSIPPEGGSSSVRERGLIINLDPLSLSLSLFLS